MKLDTSIWKLTSGAGHHDGYSPTAYEGYTFEMAEHVNGNVKVILNKTPHCDSFGQSGSTWFKSAEGDWYTFDRRGIEDSFTVGKYGYASFEEAVEGQLVRVNEHLARVESEGGKVSIPGIGFFITQKRKTDLTAQLKAKGHISLHPAGMGTGYFLTTRKNGDPYCRPATSELKKFFDVKTLYVNTFDAD